MLFKKNKIWLLLGITLIAAYFAPQADSDGLAQMEDAITGDPLLTDAKQVNEIVNLNPSVTVIALQARTIEPEQDGATEIFTADFTSDPEFNKPKKHPPPKNIDITSTNIPVPPAPVPPLPFKLIGRYIEDGVPVVFVQHNNQNLVLHLGDIILDKYKLEDISANNLTFNYLPMNIKQTLNLVH